MTPDPHSESAEPPRPEEAALLSLLDELASAERVLCTSLGRGQFAAALAGRFASARVHLSLLDVYQTEQTRLALGASSANLSIACEADFPTGSSDAPLAYDAAALCVSRAGEAELVRDRLQAAYLALRPEGRLIASIDYVDDKWLAGEMESLCGRVERRVVSVSDATTPGEAVIYLGRRGADPKKIRDFRDEFAFRDRGRLIRAVSRPGVFSHRRLDLGARKILDAMEVAPGERVVDLGCGAGALACAAASRAENVVVRAVDSNARAVQATLASAALNDLANVSADLAATGVLSDAGTFSLVLANPPYYSGFKLARVFLDAANRALAPGGRLLLVTQFPEWYLSHAGAWFADVAIAEAKKYAIVSGTKR